MTGRRGSSFFLAALVMELRACLLPSPTQNLSGVKAVLLHSPVCIQW